MSWYSSCPPFSLGRILHFLYTYCGLHVAEHVECYDKKVMLYGKEYAKYSFDKDGNPEFCFTDDMFNKIQNRKKKEAIDSISYKLIISRGQRELEKKQDRKKQERIKMELIYWLSIRYLNFKRRFICRIVFMLRSLLVFMVTLSGLMV